MRTVHTLYKKLVNLYPHEFRERFGEAMEQTFRDLYRERQAEGGLFRLLVWMFAETAMGIAGEYVSVVRKGTAMKNLYRDASAAMTLEKWGAFASFVLAVVFVVPSFIYLTGQLREALGPLTYNVADFLYGPVWAASLVVAVYALKERIGELATRRMNLALLAAALAAGTMVAVACVRASNRHYHLIHPEMALESNIDVLIVWTTLVAGLIGAGMHFLGWSFVLIGWAGWVSRRLPRVMCVMYLVVGAMAMFVYLIPENEGGVILLGTVLGIWQGIVLWRGAPGETPVREIRAGQPNEA